MTTEFAPHDGHIRDPVQLQRAAFSYMRPVSVKRPFAAPKRQHRPGQRRHLTGAIVEIVGAAQQP